MMLPPRFRPRAGLTLLDVALATVIATSTTVVTAQFFRNIYEQLAPRSTSAGLRRYLLSEEMLRAQAEGLRTLRQIPLTETQCKLLTEPPKMGYNLTITRTSGPPHADQQLYYYDLVMTHNGQRIQAISMSTLRCIGTKEGQDEKIGL